MPTILRGIHGEIQTELSREPDWLALKNKAKSPTGRLARVRPFGVVGSNPIPITIAELQLPQIPRTPPEAFE